MHAELREFVAHLIGTVAATLVPVLLIVFTTLPMSLHHHIGCTPPAPNAALQHMT